MPDDGVFPIEWAIPAAPTFYIISVAVGWAYYSFYQGVWETCMVKYGVLATRTKATQSAKDHLQDMLPSDKRGALQVISAQGHYVEIETEKGNHTVRMPFKKVVALIEEDLGTVANRSVWVAKNLVGQIYYHNGNPRVEMKDGRTFAIGRDRIKSFRHDTQT